MTPEEFKNRLLPIKNKLYRFALSFSNNRQEAEDTVQEVYLKMWDMRKDLKKYRSTEALMMTITKNVSLDKLKGKKNKAISLNEQIAGSVFDENPERKTEQSDLMKKLKEIIRNLPEQQKTVVHLRDVEGYDFEEIIKITGYDMNYLRVNLSRGRKKIRETMIKIHDYETGRN